MHKGIAYASGAYILWGLLPLFWHMLNGVPAIETLAHRMVWSLAVVVVLLTYQRHWRWLGAIVRDWRVLLAFVASGVLLAVNWGVYIWAVNTGHVLESSLGYFINPLVNVLLGVVILKERPRFWQIVAILIALVGVLYLTLTHGTFPWIGLTLAFSFGFYALIRKTAKISSLEGLTLETLTMFFPALLYLISREALGVGVFGHTDLQTTILLMSTGVITAFPLLMFASGARHLTMTTLGILQYLSPTLQFFIGVWVFHEPLSTERLIGFIIIWLALVIYSGESVLRNARGTRLQAAAGGR